MRLSSFTLVLSQLISGFRLAVRFLPSRYTLVFFPMGVLVITKRRVVTRQGNDRLPRRVGELLPLDWEPSSLESGLSLNGLFFWLDAKSGQSENVLSPKKVIPSYSRVYFPYLLDVLPLLFRH